MSMVGRAKGRRSPLTAVLGYWLVLVDPFVLVRLIEHNFLRIDNSEACAKLSFTVLLEDIETILPIWIMGEWFYNKELELALFWLY